MSSWGEIPTTLPKGGVFILPSSPKNWPGTSSNIRISILDSSFNPPHRAHLALASLPPISAESPYSAHLLLFSLTNVEKKATPSDPSLTQRLHLMSLLARHLPENTAIGLINEPTFVGKSVAIHSHLSTLPHIQHKPELSFVIGTDTLVRCFDEKFYTSQPGGMDGSLHQFFTEEGSNLISGRRGGEEERKIEEELLKRQDVGKWVEAGKVALMGTGKDDWIDISSTKIREAVKLNDWARVEALTVPEVAQYIREEGLYRH